MGQRDTRTDRRAAGMRRPGAWPLTAGAWLRVWPWLGSAAAFAVVVLIVGAVRHWDFRGIEGFSTTNYGWLAFSLVGGAGLAFRLAGRPARWEVLVRPLAAAAAAFAACFVAVTVMGVVFLPGQPLGETLTTDAPGRAVWIAVAVVALGYAAELIRPVVRRGRR